MNLEKFESFTVCLRFKVFQFGEECNAFIIGTGIFYLFFYNQKFCSNSLKLQGDETDEDGFLVNAPGDISIISSWKKIQDFKLNEWNNFCVIKNQEELTTFMNAKIQSSWFTEKSDDIGPTSIFLFNDNTISYVPFKGKIADLNVWGRALSIKEIKELVTFNKSSNSRGDIYAWNLSDLVHKNLSVYNQDEKSIYQTENEILIHEFKKLSFNPNSDIKFCTRLGMQIAVSTDQTIFWKMYNQSKGQDFFLGYQYVKGSWIDVVEHKAPKLDLKINSTSSESEVEICSYFSKPYNQSYAFPCGTNGARVLCQDNSSTQKVFQLDGIRNKFIDSSYIWINASYLHGYATSFMIFNSTTEIWEIRNSSNNIVLADLRTKSAIPIPIGLHEWHIKKFSNSESQTQNLNLHLKVIRPGNFCCYDGDCIDSKNVCDSIPHCHENEDEQNCQLIEPPLHDSETPSHQIKIIGGEKQIEKSPVWVSIDMRKIFSVNEMDSIFEVYFEMQLNWFDMFARFEYLKEGENTFANKSGLWIPELEFMFMKKHHEFEPMFSIEKNPNEKPTLAIVENDPNPREVYQGRNHLLHKRIMKRAEFICSFDNIKYYTFAPQFCEFGFFLKGPAFSLATLIPANITHSTSSVSQYQVRDWMFKNGTENTVWVIVKLDRQLYSIFMVTYLPTILMNIINQASIFISGDSKYDLIYTINITSLMVLTSIYLSVSTSLPITQDIKPVEIWLLFNMFYPFTVMLVNIIIQV